MATLDDILTTQKNGVVAINALTTALSSFLAAYQSTTGTSSSAGISSSTGLLVDQGAGRIVTVNVIVAGSTDGYIYDLASIPSGGPTSASLIGVLPMTVGVYPVNIVYTNGIVVVTGTGQTVSLTYS
jgi:hypothetical protein